MKKRLKSFGIVSGSMILTALVSVLPTVEFANLVEWFKGIVTDLGVPLVVWSFGTAFISQLWFAWRNRVIISKAVDTGKTASASSFRDTRNELY